MKRAVCLIFVLLIATLSITSCLPDPPSTQYYINGKVGVHKFDRTGFESTCEVTEIVFDISGDCDVIKIPDFYDGAKITEVGGHYYCCDARPFGEGLYSYGISRKNDLKVVGSSTFTVYIDIGRYVKRILYPNPVYFYVDAGNGFYYEYKALFIWRCDERNENYTMIDGVPCTENGAKDSILYGNDVFYTGHEPQPKGTAMKTYSGLLNYPLDCSGIDSAVIDLTQGMFKSICRVGYPYKSDAEIRPYGDGVITKIVDEKYITSEETFEVKVIVSKDILSVNLADFWFLRRTDGGYVRYRSHLTFEYK